MIKLTRLYTEFLRRYWFVILAVLVILRLPSLFEPYWYGDEGIYLVLGQAIRRGLVLYRDIHDNKPPLLYLLAAVGQTVFGFRLLLALVMVPTIYYFYRLALKLLDSETTAKVVTLIFTILSSIPLIEGHLANAEVFMLLPTILGVYYILRASSPTHYLLAGLLLGLAFVIKIPVFIEAGFLGLWIMSPSITFFPKFSYSLPRFKTNLSLAILLLIGFLIPMFLFGIYYYSQGVLPQYLNAALFQNIGYLSSWATGTHSGSSSQGGILVRGLILLFAWSILYIAHHRYRLEKHFYFTLAWFAATLFGATLSTRPYPHYLIQVLPPLVIILGFLVYSSLKNKLISVAAITSLLFVVFHYHFYFYPTLSYYLNFYSHAVSLKSQRDYRNFFGPRVDDNYKLVEYLDSNLNQDDRIFVWGDEPYIYALSNRLPVGRFTVAYHIVDFKAHQETIQKLQAWLPKAIIVYPMSGRDFPELSDFLRSYYIVDRQIGDAYIFRSP